MQNFCEQFGPCSAIPPEWHWVMAIIMPVLMIVLVGVPVANILHRAGRSRWWTILDERFHETCPLRSSPAPHKIRPLHPTKSGPYQGSNMIRTSETLD
jgi:hypothetical protein